MKKIAFFILFLVQISTYGVQIYSIEHQLKVYSSFANLANIYEIEKNRIYNQIPSAYARDERPLFLSQKMKNENRKDVVNFHSISHVDGNVEVDANIIFRNLINNPIAGHNPINPYNDGSDAGFCYGRALFVQRELEKKNVPSDRIFKVFIIGELFDGNIIWQYHVATMYIDHNGKKLMIDSLMDQVYEFDIWYEKMNSFVLNKKDPIFRIYFAEAKKFQAQSGVFQSIDVFNPIYKNYFFDLMIWL